MSGQPWYFGSALRSRFAMVHWPEVPVRAAVVICPPLGYEAVSGHAALRELADRLAALGVVAVRVDYDGTGNSVGLDTDPDRVQQWRGTILDCVHELSALGFDEVTLVGLRVGALLAASAAAETSLVQRVVLWDPPTSGRRFVRGLRLLAATGALDVAEGSELVVAGVAFPDAALGDLARLGSPLETAASSTSRVLLVHPAELGAAPDTAAQDTVETVTLPGTAALLDTSVETAEVPDAILDLVSEWVAGQAPAALARQPRPGPFPSSASEDGPAGVVRHRAERVGPHQLFAVVTEPAESDGRVVIMLNNGAASQIGPGRAWVAWAHELAERGIATIRVDLRGLGDSRAGPGEPPGEAYPLTAGQDVADVVAYARDGGAVEVVLLGLCSGALLAFDGLKADAQVDALVTVNGRFDKPWSDAGRRGGNRRAAGRTPSWLAVPLSKSPLFPAFDRVPTWTWWLLARLRLVASPAVSLRQRGRHDVRLLMVFGTDEWGLRALRRRAPREFAKQCASSRVELEVLSGLDHSMFDLTARARVFDTVCEFLGRTLGWPLEGQERRRAVELRGPSAGHEQSHD